MPVTTRARTLLDCAAVLPYESFETLLQNAVTSGHVTLEAMFAILEHRGGRGVEGTVATRRALANGLVDEKIQRRLELILARIIDRARVPRPQRQYELVCADGRRVVLDNAWADRKIAVEGVGLRWHGNATQARRRRERSRSTTATGWEHYEYGWYETTETPGDVQRELESFWGESGRLWLPDPAQNGEEEEAAA